MGNNHFYHYSAQSAYSKLVKSKLQSNNVAKKKNLRLGLCFSVPSLVNNSNSFFWAVNSPIEVPCLHLVYLFGVTALSPVGCRDTGAHVQHPRLALGNMHPRATFTPYG